MFVDPKTVLLVHVILSLVGMFAGPAAPVFAATQSLVLVLFSVLGVASVKGFRIARS